MSDEIVHMNVALKGSRLAIDETRDFIEASGLETNVITPSPLHFGMEEVTLGLSIIGTVASLLSLLESLSKRKPNCEVHVETDDGEIVLKKDKPWKASELRKVLRLGR